MEYMRRMSPRREWMWVGLLALAWALGPLLPALLRGEIPGQPWTDLYPSVWGMAVLAEAWPALPTHTDWLGAPAGIGFWYSSPLHGWLGAPLTRLAGAPTAYTATLVAARAATVMVAFGCFRTGLGFSGALGAAFAYGASPFFHGYAVEGIVEGTDGWTLPLWVWALRRERPGLAGLAFGLVLWSSWYLGMVACALAAAWGFFRRSAWVSAAIGLLVAAPALYAFLGAFDAAPLDPALRRAMGAPLGWRRPGFTAGVQPFALNTWLGLSLPTLALLSARRAPLLALGALGTAILSTGWGPWWELPPLAMVRFPYRWHAGSLLLLAALAGLSLDRWPRLWWLPWLEGFCLSPIEPILPGAPRAQPAIYDRVSGPLLLELPGPVAMPPGELNPSRPRARHWLYGQLAHGAASPWVPDFNGVNPAGEAPWLRGFRSWDRLAEGPPEVPDLAAARAAGVSQLLLHRDELRQLPALEQALRAGGAVELAREGKLVLWGLGG